MQPSPDLAEKRYWRKWSLSALALSLVGMWVGPQEQIDIINKTLKKCVK